MKKSTVLITGAGAPGAPGIIRSLRNNGERPVYIIGVDMDPKASGFSMVDEWYTVPNLATITSSIQCLEYALGAVLTL